MPTIINRSGTSAVFHTAANATITVVGGSGVSNIASPGETISGGAITQVWWGASGAGYWNVKRDTTPLLTLSGTGYVDYAGCGASLTANSTSTIVCELVDTSNGYILIEVQKIPQSTGYTQ